MVSDSLASAASVVRPTAWPRARGWPMPARCSVPPVPALVAAVTGEDVELCGVHRSWLDPVHPVLAPVARPRKALGRIHGFAVRFTSAVLDRLLHHAETVVTDGT